MTVSCDRKKAARVCGKWLTVVSGLLFTSGAGLLLLYGSSLALAARSHQQGLAAFAAVREEAGAAAADSGRVILQDRRHEAPAGPDQTDWSDKRIADYEALREAGGLDELPTGIMRIPSVDLEIPLYDGTEEHNLTRGAGVIEGTAPLGARGNTGLAAHRDGYFRSLKNVRVGAEIEVETIAATYRYRVSEIIIVEPEDIQVLDPTDDSSLTLVTCYPFYFVGSAPQRYIVRADIIRTVASDGRSQARGFIGETAFLQPLSIART